VVPVRGTLREKMTRKDGVYILDIYHRTTGARETSV
jgi:hypothetical protein